MYSINEPADDDSVEADFVFIRELSGQTSKLCKVCSTFKYLPKLSYNIECKFSRDRN